MKQEFFYNPDIDYELLEKIRKEIKRQKLWESIRAKPLPMAQKVAIWHDQCTKAGVAHDLPTK